MNKFISFGKRCGYQTGVLFILCMAMAVSGNAGSFVIGDFESGQLGKWTGSPEGQIGPGQLTIESGGAKGTNKCLKLFAPEAKGGTAAIVSFTPPVSAGFNVLEFSLRSPQMRRLTLDVILDDGSRWQVSFAPEVLQGL